MPIYDRWVLPSKQAPTVPEWDFAPSLQSILWKRGVRESDELRRFLRPTLDDLHDPAEIHGIDHACDRIFRAIRNREKILIYGDYDVDGVTSIVLLKTVLGILGGDVGFVVPHRLVDGYGLKTEVLERVLREGQVRLVITVDCGITSVDPVERALEQGIDVIITDHHLPPGVLPAAAAVLNPKQEGCTYPFKDLAGVGVAFKLCCELAKRAKRSLSVESLLKIAALGTIADVAPLIGENRTIALLGLRGLTDVRNHGLRALLRTLGLYGRRVRAADVAFRIGPRINAAGRLASANTAIDLFSASSELAAYPMIGELNRLNGERKTVERRVLTEAEADLDGRGELERILVCSGNAWHRGVVGLCAARLAQKYHRPTLVISVEGDQAAGSARSIRGVNLHGLLDRVRDLFDHFGGHEYACGFTLRADRVTALAEALGEMGRELEVGLFRRDLEVDAELSLSDLDDRFLFDHGSMEPFGAGNRQPVFLFRDLLVRSRREFAPGCFELSVESGKGSARAVLWSGVSQGLPEIPGGGRLCLAAEVEPDDYAPGRFRLSVLDLSTGEDISSQRNETNA